MKVALKRNGRHCEGTASRHHRLKRVGRSQTVYLKQQKRLTDLNSQREGFVRLIWSYDYPGKVSWLLREEIRPWHDSLASCRRTEILHGYNARLKLNKDHPESFISYKSIVGNNRGRFHCMEKEGCSALLSETECFPWMNALFYKRPRRASDRQWITAGPKQSHLWLWRMAVLRRSWK